MEREITSVSPGCHLFLELSLKRLKEGASHEDYSGVESRMVRSDGSWFGHPPYQPWDLGTSVSITVKWE